MSMDRVKESVNHRGEPDCPASNIAARLEMIVARVDGIALRVDAVAARVDTLMRIEAIAPRVETVATEVRELRETTDVLAEILKAGFVNQLMGNIYDAMQEEEDRSSVARAEPTVASAKFTLIAPPVLTPEQQQKVNHRLLTLWTDPDGNPRGGKAGIFLTTDPIRQAITAGADVNVKDKTGQTALMMAVTSGRVDSVMMLLSAGADKNAKSQAGDTVLMMAVTTGQVEMVKTLLNAGADWTTTDKNGRTAYWRARHSLQSPFWKNAIIAAFEAAGVEQT